MTKNRDLYGKSSKNMNHSLSFLLILKWVTKLLFDSTIFSRKTRRWVDGNIWNQKIQTSQNVLKISYAKKTNGGNSSRLYYLLNKYLQSEKQPKSWWSPPIVVPAPPSPAGNNIDCLFKGVWWKIDGSKEVVRWLVWSFPVSLKQKETRMELVWVVEVMT